MTTYVKMLEPNGKSPFQGYVWPLPTQNESGEWTSRHGYKVQQFSRLVREQ